MDHVAIMNPSWNLIPKILSAQKIIESRWYQTRRAPWDRIKVGDRVFFKNSGRPVIAKAQVSRIRQIDFHGSLDIIKSVIDQYKEDICLVNEDISTWGSIPRYAIFIWLINPEALRNPFYIDKTGFGSATAWVTVSNIDTIIKT